MPVLTDAGDGWSQPASSEIEPAGASRYPLVGCPRASTASAVMISVPAGAESAVPGTGGGGGAAGLDGSDADAAAGG